MPIPLSCECGRALRVKDEAAGRKVRCPSCGAVLTVPRPHGEKDAEDEALDILLSESPADERTSPPPPTPGAGHVQERAPGPASPPEPSRPGWARRSGSDRPKINLDIRKKKREDSGGGIAIHPAILAGIAMMAGGALWFFLGLAAGWIYAYPVVLFFLGIGSVIRGFKGEE